MGDVKIGDDVLIYDIETATEGRPNPEVDQFKAGGLYSYKTKKDYVVYTIEEMKLAIDKHKVLVGFNNKGYDNPILEREGISFKGKTIVDLKRVFEDRCGQMKIKEGILSDLLMRFSLDYITRTLKLVDDNTAKGDLDYEILKKNTWTVEEKRQINEYTQRDIEITKKLYEWCEDYFWGFRGYINDYDIEKKVYLTAGFPMVAYKAICKELGWREEFNKEALKFAVKSIGGGYVSYPAGEKFDDSEGQIYCDDWASLYSHIMMQANLYGRKKEDDINDRPTWNGGGIWKIDGHYYSDEMAKVGKLIKKWYNQRKIFKEQGDKREYSLKIFINIVYGILDFAFYKHTADKVASNDCTALGRQWNKYAKQYFIDKGYKVLYQDTDSSYLIDVYNDKERLLKTMKEIADYIRSTVPFPQETFQLDIDDIISHMFFFKGKDDKEKDSKFDDEHDKINKKLGLLKKNYIYITKNGDVKFKNLGVKKKSCSLITRKIFSEYIIPRIKKEKEVKFSKTYFKNLINELLEKDISLASMRKTSGQLKEYANESVLPAQITKRYGSGIHFLIPNLRKIGVGKGKSYCTIEEFKDNGLKISDIDLSGVWSELSYFIKPVVHRNIFSFEAKK